MTDKKIAIFGCKNTTLFLIRELLENLNHVNTVTISKESAEKNQVADYCDITKEVDFQKTTIYVAKSYNLNVSEDVKNIVGMNIDIAFVNGWQRLIPKEILDSVDIGVFGMHGSAMDLPLGRGRSPMNWSIIEDRKYFYTNLFKYEEGVDSGMIVDRVKFEIRERDTAESMHFKNTLAMCYLVTKNLKSLLDGDPPLRAQSDKKPTYYPKRTPEDGLIDLRRDIYFIERFIRAVTRPFDGAFLFCNSQRVTIYRADVFDNFEFGYEYSDVGKVVAVFPNKKFLLKLNGGLLLVHDYESKLDLEKNMILDNYGHELKNFPFNEFGFHDLRDEKEHT